MTQELEQLREQYTQNQALVYGGEKLREAHVQAWRAAPWFENNWILTGRVYELEDQIDDYLDGKKARQIVLQGELDPLLMVAAQDYLVDRDQKETELAEFERFHAKGKLSADGLNRFKDQFHDVLQRPAVDPFLRRGLGLLNGGVLDLPQNDGQEVIEVPQSRDKVTLFGNEVFKRMPSRVKVDNWKVEKIRQKGGRDMWPRLEDRIIWEFIQDFEQYVRYEDEDVLVVDKPDGISAQTNRRDRLGVEDVVQSIRGESTFSVYNLERAITGLVMFSKSDAAKIAFGDSAFPDGNDDSGVKRTFLAIVDGEFDSRDEMRIELPIGRRSLHQMRVVEPYQVGIIINKFRNHMSVTTVKPIGVATYGMSANTLVEVYPVTDLPHQLRLVLSHIGHPIEGDPLYGRYGDVMNKSGRALLHLHQITFTHPVTQEEKTVTSPLPKDFQGLLRDLELFE